MTLNEIIENYVPDNMDIVMLDSKDNAVITKKGVRYYKYTEDGQCHRLMTHLSASILEAKEGPRCPEFEKKMD